MGWESVGVVRYDLGPLFQGQTRIYPVLDRVALGQLYKHGLNWLCRE